MLRRLLILPILVCLLVGSRLVCSAANAVPTLSGPVVDNARILSEQEFETVKTLLFAMQKSGKVQMAVLIIGSLEGTPIENYSIAVAEKWKLGHKKKDEGLLFVVAVSDHKMRLEVGSGLEGDLTDVESKRLLDDVVRPFFKANRYGPGIIAAIQGVARKLQIELPGVAQEVSPDHYEAPPPVSEVTPSRHRDFSDIMFLFIIALVILASIFGGGTGYWGGGGGGGSWGGGSSGGGDSFSGGGGGFSGGGASSSW